MRLSVLSELSKSLAPRAVPGINLKKEQREEGRKDEEGREGGRGGFRQKF